MSKTVTTASEMHVPVGRTILLELSSHDVIHSFWVPRLAGKIDLIPSRINQAKLFVEAPGRFRGQCAEFCGQQHAHMAFWVIAEADRDYETWLEHERAPAKPPADELLAAARRFSVRARESCATAFAEPMRPRR